MHCGIFFNASVEMKRARRPSLSLFMRECTALTRLGCAFTPLCGSLAQQAGCFHPADQIETAIAAGAGAGLHCTALACTAVQLAACICTQGRLWVRGPRPSAVIMPGALSQQRLRPQRSIVRLNHHP